MKTNPSEYYVAGERPVKIVFTKDGGMIVLKYNFETGRFDYGMEYLSRVLLGKDDVEKISKDEFEQYVEKLRGQNLKGEGTVYTLYELINSIENDAKEKGQELTIEDKKLIVNLRRRTHKLFEETTEGSPNSSA